MTQKRHNFLIPPRTTVLTFHNEVFCVAGFARQGARPVMFRSSDWFSALDYAMEVTKEIGCEMYIEWNAHQQITRRGV